MCFLYGYKIIKAFSMKKYEWKVRVIEKFDKPIEAKGKLGLWNFERK